MRLAGKGCVITGGASGIGRVSSLLFAREGARVVVADRDGAGAERVAGEVRDSGGEAHAVQVDVASAADSERMFREAEDTFGAVHVVFNNAGIFRADDGLC